MLGCGKIRVNIININMILNPDKLGLSFIKIFAIEIILLIIIIALLLFI